MSTPLYKYFILQKCENRSKWWEWPYSSFFLPRVKNAAKRLREAAEGRCEYKIVKKEVDKNGNWVRRSGDGGEVPSGVRLRNPEQAVDTGLANRHAR